jgi:murein L,D-transpeptidase YafK
MGACSSAGCYTITDEQIAEIYALARESFPSAETAAFNDRSAAGRIR